MKSRKGQSSVLSRRKGKKREEDTIASHCNRRGGQFGVVEIRVCAGGKAQKVAEK